MSGCDGDSCYRRFGGKTYGVIGMAARWREPRRGAVEVASLEEEDRSARGVSETSLRNWALFMVCVTRVIEEVWWMVV